MLKLENCKCNIDGEKFEAIVALFDVQSDEVTIITEDGQPNRIIGFEDVEYGYFENERYRYQIGKTQMYGFRTYYASINAYIDECREKGLGV